MRTDDFAARLGTVGELLVLLKENKRWWLIPLVVVLALVVVLLIFAQVSGVSPFVYPGF